jgi:CRISPR-associated protein (TIGR03984 family)
MKVTHTWELSLNTRDALIDWLLKQAGDFQLRWLLSHADDGVIWGEVVNRRLMLSSQAAPQVSPDLRPQTLQTLRLFSPSGELMLWRYDGQWWARLLEDEPEQDCIVEEWVLWGDQTASTELDGFTLLTENRQDGLQHAVPWDLSEADAKDRRLRLCVHSDIIYDSSHQARLGYSRLVKLDLKSQEEKS